MESITRIAEQLALLQMKAMALAEKKPGDWEWAGRTRELADAAAVYVRAVESARRRKR